MKTLLVGALAIMSLSAFAGVGNCVSFNVPLELGKSHALTKAVNKYEQGHYAKKVVVKKVSIDEVCEADKKGNQTLYLEYRFMGDGVDLSCDAEAKVDDNGNYFDVRSLCEA